MLFKDGLHVDIERAEGEKKEMNVSRFSLTNESTEHTYTVEEGQVVVFKLDALFSIFPFTILGSVLNEEGKVIVYKYKGSIESTPGHLPVIRKVRSMMTTTFAPSRQIESFEQVYVPVSMSVSVCV